MTQVPSYHSVLGQQPGGPHIVPPRPGSTSSHSPSPACPSTSPTGTHSPHLLSTDLAGLSFGFAPPPFAPPSSRNRVPAVAASRQRPSRRPCCSELSRPHRARQSCR